MGHPSTFGHASNSTLQPRVSSAAQSKHDEQSVIAPWQSLPLSEELELELELEPIGDAVELESNEVELEPLASRPWVVTSAVLPSDDVDDPDVIVGAVSDVTVLSLVVNVSPLVAVGEVLCPVLPCSTTHCPASPEAACSP